MAAFGLVTPAHVREEYAPANTGGEAGFFPGNCSPPASRPTHTLRERETETEREKQKGREGREREKGSKSTARRSPTKQQRAFPGSSVVKDSLAISGTRLDPWVGKIPWRRAW